MFRVEDKYALTTNECQIIKERLGTLIGVDQNDINQQGYKISSLYFDNVYDSSLKDTIAGTPLRHKYRIRIYNDSLDVIKLEVKTKYYNRISKQSVNISYEDMLKLIRSEAIEQGDDFRDPKTVFNIGIKAEGLRPKIIVTYERKAFVYDFGNVRITLDENIRGSNQIQQFGISNLSYEYPTDNYPVLEVKYDEFLPDFIAQILEINNLWKISTSKYRLCREIYYL